MAEAEGGGMKVAELTGERLNEWVARSLGMRLTTWAGQVVLDTFGDDHLSPPPDFQGDWSQGGPLIHEKRIHIAQAPDCCWASVGIDAEHWIQGPDELTAVFPYRSKRGYRFNAYTRVYNPEWKGCNLVDVEAASGNQAKKMAIEVIRGRLLYGTSEEVRSVKVADA